ncbi:MAG TPA: hypothetical protein VD767_03020, partial [Thermomicrobiales bacterium]|nr:hypothetical protein [Thermomicrobiales bacterium]
LLETAWNWSDTATVATAAVAIVAVLGLATSDAPALTYSPYPDLAFPSVPVWTMLALSLLLVPAFLAPAPDSR